MMIFIHEALTLLKADQRLPVNWNPEPITLSNGITVQVGVSSISGTKNFMVGQFFPIGGPGVVTMYKAEVSAIRPIFIP